jgi:hypothetical protein
MTENMGEIKKLLTQILEKLDVIELEIEKQEEEISTSLEKEGSNLNPDELFLLSQKSTRTMVELLRGEIEELHQIVRILFNEANNNKE